jgi:hypothetical protein
MAANSWNPGSFGFPIFPRISIGLGLDVLFLFVLFGDFRIPFLAIFLEQLRDLSLWDLVGDVCMNLPWFFSL